MKKLRKGIMALAAFALVAGLTLTGCNSDSDDDGTTAGGNAAGLVKALKAQVAKDAQLKVDGSTVNLSGNLTLDKELEIPTGVTLYLDSAAKQAVTTQAATVSGIVFQAKVNVVGTLEFAATATVRTTAAAVFDVGGTYRDLRSNAADPGVWVFANTATVSIPRDKLSIGPAAAVALGPDAVFTITSTVDSYGDPGAIYDIAGAGTVQSAWAVPQRTVLNVTNGASLNLTAELTLGSAAALNVAAGASLAVDAPITAQS